MELQNLAEVQRNEAIVLGCRLTLVAYLDGERSPNLPNATGTLANIRTTATRADFARAAVEGVLCGLLEGGDILARHGVTGSGRLILTGGAARSRGYRQVLADLTGRTVWTCPMTEAPPLAPLSKPPPL